MPSAPLPDEPAPEGLRPRVLADESGAVLAVVPTRRRGSHPSRYRYVRKVKGRSYQARVHVGPSRTDQVNLGLFGEFAHGSMEMAEWAAGRAVREFVRRYRPGSDLWAVVESLKRDGLIPARVLPKWVHALPGGGFAARVRKAGRVVCLEGPYPTPAAAHAAMARRLGRQATAAARLPPDASTGRVGG